MKNATKKTARKKSSSGSDPKSKKIVHKKMQDVMHEFKHHELRRGQVKNPKQAIAIGLSEARRSGADIPPNPNERKSKRRKMATKKAATKKAAKKGAKKAVKKSPAKKSMAKKATKKATKKTAAKKR